MVASMEHPGVSHTRAVMPHVTVHVLLQYAAAVGS